MDTKMRSILKQVLKPGRYTGGEYGQIIKDNLFTLFNLVNTILAICIAIVGSWKNGLFFLVVIWNFLTGCIQEIRAKKTIDKLSLLSAPKAHVLRDAVEAWQSGLRGLRGVGRGVSGQ